MSSYNANHGCPDFIDVPENQYCTDNAEYQLRRRALTAMHRNACLYQQVGAPGRADDTAEVGNDRKNSGDRIDGHDRRQAAEGCLIILIMVRNETPSGYSFCVF